MTVTGALAGAAHPGLDTDLFAHHLPPSARIPQTKSCQWLFVLSNNAELLLKHAEIGRLRFAEPYASLGEPYAILGEHRKMFTARRKVFK